MLMAYVSAVSNCEPDPFDPATGQPLPPDPGEGGGDGGGGDPGDGGGGDPGDGGSGDGGDGDGEEPGECPEGQVPNEITGACEVPCPDGQIEDPFNAGQCIPVCAPDQEWSAADTMCVCKDDNQILNAERQCIDRCYSSYFGGLSGAAGTTYPQRYCAKADGGASYCWYNIASTPSDSYTVGSVTYYEFNSTLTGPSCSSPDAGEGVQTAPPPTCPEGSTWDAVTAACQSPTSTECPPGYTVSEWSGGCVPPCPSGTTEQNGWCIPNSTGGGGTGGGTGGTGGGTGGGDTGGGDSGGGDTGGGGTGGGSTGGGSSGGDVGGGDTGGGDSGGDTGGGDTGGDTGGGDTGGDTGGGGSTGGGDSGGDPDGMPGGTGWGTVTAEDLYTCRHCEKSVGQLLDEAGGKVKNSDVYRKTVGWFDVTLTAQPLVCWQMTLPFFGPIQICPDPEIIAMVRKVLKILATVAAVVIVWKGIFG